MRPLLASSFLVLGLALSSLTGCGGSTTDVSDGAVALTETARTIEASTLEEHDSLSYLWQVHSVELANGLTARLYEHGGGDPAFNGAELALAIDGGPGNQTLWNLHLNVRTVDSLTANGADGLIVHGTEDTFDSELDDIVNRPFVTKLTFVKNADAEGVIVATMQGPHAASKMDEGALTFGGSTYALHTVENADVIARVYEIGGGDPAMNGDHLFVSLMSYPEVKVFDLGLDVATVSNVSFASPTELRIEGSEDTRDDTGEIRPQAFTYHVSFTLAEEGLGQSVKLVKK